MHHRSQVEMVDADRSPDEILTRIPASPHIRLPVFRDSDENILGVIHAKDLLREAGRPVRRPQGNAKALADPDILKIAMKPRFVPDTTALEELTRPFLKRHTHSAPVVDEDGALRGRITLNDIPEVIVGEITDEFDLAHDTVLTRAGNGDCRVEGSMTIRDLNRAMDWQGPDDGATATGGPVIHEAQMIPNGKQAFSFHGFRSEW